MKNGGVLYKRKVLRLYITNQITFIVTSPQHMCLCELNS